MKPTPAIPKTSRLYAGRQLRALAARWNARAASWDQQVADPACHLNEDAAYQRFLSTARRVVAARRRFCAHHGLIDLGCGTGLVLAELASAFAWSIGVDISPRMISRAQAKQISSARFIVGDCFQLPRLCPPAGAIISRGVLLSHYGLAQAQALLTAAKESLVQEGFLLFDFLNAAAQTRYRHQAEEKTHFTSTQITALARQAGFIRAKILGRPERRVLRLLANKP